MTHEDDEMIMRVCNQLRQEGNTDAMAELVSALSDLLTRANFAPQFRENIDRVN